MWYNPDVAPKGVILTDAVCSFVPRQGPCKDPKLDYNNLDCGGEIGLDSLMLEQTTDRVCDQIAQPHSWMQNL